MNIFNENQYPQISVIVPVYNGSVYLNTLVDSILQQTFHDFELLLINDGSTDNSLEIIRDYEKKDTRVHCLDKKNSGVSDTRNYGLEKARGKYIVFTDCDDYMYPDNLEVMFKEVQGFDLVTCAYAQGNRGDLNTIYRKGTITERVEAHNMTEIGERILGIDVWYMAMCWNKMYLRSVIEDNCLRFRNMKSEDEIWSYEVLNCVKSVKRIDWMGLCYFHNPGSLGNGHKAIPELDWIIKQDETYQKIVEKFDITDQRYINRIKYRFIIRISSFLLKGYHTETYVNRKERLKRWKESRQFEHRVNNFNSVNGLSKTRLLIIWILNHRMETLADFFIVAVCKFEWIKGVFKRI